MLLLAASLVSCEKESHEPASDKTPIKFGKVETRASVNSVDDMKGEGKGDGFGVLASMNGAAGTSAAAVYSLFMENENVYWDDTYDAWTYDNTQYWTKGRNYHFFAYHPYEAAPTDAKPISAVEMNAYFGYDMTFTTPQTADFDLLSAYMEVDTGADDFDASDPVTLAFNHKLVNVNLNIWRDGGKHQNDQMRIREVTLSNIRKGGTYSSNTDSWEPSDDRLTLEKTYENVSDDDNIGAVIVKDDGTLDAGGSSPATPFEDIMLIPQTLDGSSPVYLKIQYELKRNNAVDWESAELEAVLPSVTWMANRRYTYNVVLSSVTDITVYYIQTKVDPWGTPQVGGTVIIK